MNTQAIQGILIQRLGALEQRRFDRVCRGVALARPLLTALLLARLGHAMYDYVSVSDQVSMIEDSLAATRREFAQRSGAQVNKNDTRGGVESLPGGGASDAATLEVINRIAVGQGIDLEEARSGVRCDSNEPTSSRQIHVMFRAHFSQLREFNHRLNDHGSTLVTESLLVERDISFESPGAITAKICISVVTKTS